MERSKSDLEALDQFLRSRNSPTHVFLGLLGIFEKKNTGYRKKRPLEKHSGLRV